MSFFNQRKDTIEWNEYRDDILFYKWGNNELKRGSTLIVRAGQKAIFYYNGAIEGVFENPGSFDIDTEIIPFLTTIKSFFELKKDSGIRTDIYFVNAKEMVLNWGTRQRIMIPTTEVPSGIPVGMNGNLVIEFRDYLKFIDKIAGIKTTYTLADVTNRILGELDGIISEAVLAGQQTIGLNALVAIQANNRTLSKKMCEELDKEMFDIGLGVRDLNIISVNYPEEIQKMAEKVAGQSFVQDTAKYATIAMADGMESGDGNNMAAMGAQMAMGMQMAQQFGATPTAPASAVPAAAAETGDRFCPKCRKMTNGKFCADCGTETV